MKTRFCFLILVLFLAAAQLSAQNYTVTDLGTLGGNYSGAAAINNLGQVAGTSTNASNQTLATLFSGNGTGNINLGTLGGDTSYATAINDNGTIVGYSYFDVSFIFHATQFSGTGTGNIDLAGPGAASVPSFANGINQSGTVVGYRFNGANANAVLFGPNGVGNVLLGTLGGAQSVATAINSAGQIVGYANNAGNKYRATLFSGTGTGNADLGIVDAAANDNIISQSFAINNSGEIVGMSFSNSSSDNFPTLFSGTGNVNLGTLGGSNNVAYGINNSGVIVGSSRTSGNQERGFVWRNGILTDLNTLIPANSGIVIRSANAINDSGQIAATGTVNGNTRALRLDPGSAPLSYSVSVLLKPKKGGSVTGAGTYSAGAVVTLKAKAKPGSDFVSWKEGKKILSRKKKLTLVLNSNRAITATFK